MMRRIGYIVLSLFCGTLVSCRASDGAPEPDPVPENVRMNFRISVGDGYGSTRALPGESGVEPGSGYENFIDIYGADFRFLLFSAADDTFLDAFVPEAVTPVDDSAYPQEYEVSGTMQTPPSGDFKLMVLANWGAYPDSFADATVRDICSGGVYGGIYSYEPGESGYLPSQDSPIPMYGIRTCTDVVFHNDAITFLGTVDLLRALAKVEVRCNTEGLELTGVTIRNYNTAGYCAPLDMYANTAYTETVHLPEGRNSAGSLSFAPGREGAYTIYLPEYDNTSGSSLPAVISLTLRNAGTGREETYTDAIEFRDYAVENGERFDIVRNYCYRFTVDVSTEMTIDYVICPWDEETGYSNIVFN